MVVAESGYQTLEKPHRDAPIMSEGKGFVLGLDIGKDRDHSVVAIVEWVWESSIKRPYVNVVRYLDQYPLETHYRDVVADVMDRFIRSGFLTLPEEEYRPTVGARRTEPLLIIDATGIGDDVADRFLEAGLERRNLKRVVITGGLSETKPKAKYGVPKSRLLEAFRGAANFDTLKVASSTPLLDQLRKQIPNIKPKERADNRALTYEEIREAVHDDIVIAAALGHWGANKFFPIASRPVDLPPEFRAARLGRTPRSKKRGWYL
jgi:hypothetical protein